MKKWLPRITDYITQIANTVHPSYRHHSNSLDLNAFVKVKIVEWPDDSMS